MQEPSGRDGGVRRQTHVDPIREPSLRSYFSKHWKGDLSLPISFWVNGFLVTVALAEVVFVVPWNSFVSKFPKSCSWVIIALWLLIAATTIWQLVGIWRAAQTYLSQGGSRLWGTAARIAVILGLVKSLGEILGIGAPQLYEYGKIAIGRDPLGTYQLHLLKDATELEIAGAIVFGITDDVRTVLDANPAIRVIQLNSDGGRISEARNLRNLIDSRGLTTSTASACLSACTLAYAGGKSRLIARDARLGFHRYSFPGTGDADLQAQYERDKQDWMARGFARYMVDRAFSTPHNEIWIPNHEELLKWGVITGHVSL